MEERKPRFSSLGLFHMLQGWSEGRNEILGWELPSLVSQTQSLSPLTSLCQSWPRPLLLCLPRCHPVLLLEDSPQGQLSSVTLLAKDASWPNQKLPFMVPREGWAGRQDRGPHRDSGHQEALRPGLCKLQLEAQPQMPVRVLAESR